MSKSSDDMFPLCQHLDALVDDLRQYVPAALQEFDVQAVHKARVTTRRLKAALELLQAVLDHQRSKPFFRLGKKLRRRLGPLRDIDVMLGHLDEIDPANRLAPPADWLRQRLVRERETARANSTNKAPVGDVLSRLGTWWALRQDVIEANPAVTSLLGESLHSQLDQFIAQADQTAEAHDPHELRIAGKSLRYTLELAEAEGHKLPKMVLRTFKQMQECLGTWHDFVVLAERAMQACLDEDLPLHNPAMQRQVLDLIDHAMTRAQHELNRFAKLWAKQGPELFQTIRDLFPLTKAVTAPQMDHGPVDLLTPPAPEVVSTVPPPAG